MSLNTFNFLYELNHGMSGLFLLRLSLLGGIELPVQAWRCSGGRLVRCDPVSAASRRSAGGGHQNEWGQVKSTV